MVECGGELEKSHPLRYNGVGACHSPLTSCLAPVKMPFTHSRPSLCPTTYLDVGTVAGHNDSFTLAYYRFCQKRLRFQSHRLSFPIGT